MKSRFKKEDVINALKQANGKKKDAAKLLNTNYQTFRRLELKFGLSEKQVATQHISLMRAIELYKPDNRSE